MAEVYSDGTVSWIGGMDTSRDASSIAASQYSKAVNVIIPDSLGGIRARYGFHHVNLKFDSKATEEIYRKGRIQAEGWFESNNKTFQIILISGYVLKFTQTGFRNFFVENINPNNRNININTKGWIIQIPSGCIVNNGYDYPIYITEDQARRTDPSKGEIGIGQMGVYVQNRLFYVDQSGRRILASDFLEPVKFTLEGTNIFGFKCPDDDEIITAIGKQKTILSYAEGGNLIWSSSKDIYAADVRGTRSQWADLGTRVGKTTETIPGFSACSSYSFESFNSNIYFRSRQYGIVDIKQSEYQFVNLDAVNNQSIEASYFLSNDTDWMLDRCYTRSCGSRMFTTVAPERTDDGYVYWNGLLSFHPAATYINQGTAPRRFESVFTGVRPWCLTVVKKSDSRDQMFIHSFDKDEVNRMYVMDENSDYDIDSSDNKIEIQGFIETRAFNFNNPFTLKNSQRRIYSLGLTERTTNIKVYARPETHGEWVKMWDMDHKVCRARVENGAFIPENTKPQTRPMVNMSEEKFSDCYRHGNKFLAMQYRIEFTGPMSMDSFVVVANQQAFESITTREEKECTTLIYSYRPDYYYHIQKTE